MTDKEKKRIAALREQGHTYQQIADETGIGLSTIKMYFIRKKAPDDDMRYCPQCRKPFKKDAQNKRRFCSDACRSKWWRAHPEQFSQNRQHKFTCPVCGKDFFAYRATKYCSRECYFKSRRKTGVGNA